MVVAGVRLDDGVGVAERDRVADVEGLGRVVGFGVGDELGLDDDGAGVGDWLVVGCVVPVAPLAGRTRT
jgi:hypothetical protein